MDYIYGQLCERVKEIQGEYTGVETITANVNINNRTRKISVDVKFQELIDAVIDKLNTPDILVLDEYMKEPRFHVYGLSFNDLWNKIQSNGYKCVYKEVSMNTHIVHNDCVVQYDSDVDGEGNEIFLVDVSFGTSQYDPRISIFSNGDLRINFNGLTYSYSYVYNESTSEYELTETGQ